MIVAENPFVMGQIGAKVSVDSGHTPVLNTYLRDDLALANSSNALSPVQQSTRRMTGGNVDSVSTSYVSLTDLAIALNRIGGHAFEYWLRYVTAATTTGIGVQLAFDGVAVGVQYSVEAYTAPNARADLIIASAFGSGLVPYSSGPGPEPAAAIVRISGSCLVTTVGTLSPQIRSEDGGQVSMLAPSWGRVWET